MTERDVLRGVPEVLLARPQHAATIEVTSNTRTPNSFVIGASHGEACKTVRAWQRIWIHEDVFLANFLHCRSDSQLRTIRICATANHPAGCAATAMPGYSSTRTRARDL